MKRALEYIWIDGTKPTAKLRSKTKMSYEIDKWGFDGSSTGQADGKNSDCVLSPVRWIRDPFRGPSDLLVLCEVLDSNGKAGINNFRSELVKVEKACEEDECLFGFEQEYTIFHGRSPLGWPPNGYPAPQGPFYCGVGSDEAFGRPLVEAHRKACRLAGIELDGTNLEVMPGQAEYQTAPMSPLEACDKLWLSRYILYRISEYYGWTIKLHPKPVEGDWNGAGLHTNFSEKKMRKSFTSCEFACMALRDTFETDGFPKVYGHGYEERLTGSHETCSHRQFRFGVADRTASVRIPLHVKMNNGGYIEDRRPCANADPYQIAAYIMYATIPVTER